MRRNQFLTRWAIFLVLLIGFLGFANLLADRFDARIDLTEESLHTITTESAKILSDLTDKVTITYYVSEKLPPGFQNLRQDSVDFLKEYARAADGQVELRVIDPYRLIEAHVAAKRKEKVAEEGEGAPADESSPDDPAKEDPASSKFDIGEREELRWAEEKKEELGNQGIPELRGQSIEKDRFEVANFYSSIEIRYLARQPEVMSVHQSLDGLEYELANRIVKLTVETKPKVAFFLGKPDDVIQLPPDPSDPFQQGPRSIHPYEPFLKQVLAPQFDIVEVRITEDSVIPEEAKLLIVAEPNALTRRQIYEIDRSIARGRPAILLVSHTTANLEQLQAGLTPLGPSLGMLFEKWGFSLGRDLVCSEQRAPVEVVEETNFGMRMRRQVPFSLCPLIQGRGLNIESPITQGLSALVFPFASAIRANPLVLEQNGITFTPLATTSDRTWLTAWRPTLDRGMLDPPGELALREQLLAAMLEGTFPTAFEAGSPMPKWSPAGESTPPSENGTPEEAPELVVPALAGAPGQVIVIGSADFAKVTALRMYGTNIPFLLNAVETFALGQDLVKIRAKTQVARPLRKSSQGERNLAVFGNLLGVPALILFLGLARYLARGGRARGYEARFVEKEG